MMDQNQIKDTIRNCFYELLSTISSFSYIQLLEKVSLQIQEILAVDFTAIYSYNNWKQTFERFTGEEHNELPKQIGARVIKKNYYSHSNIDLHDLDSGKLQTKIIPLQMKIEPEAFLLIANQLNDDKPRTEVIEIIKLELENLLNIVNTFKVSRENEKQKTFLSDLTTNLYSIISRENVLTEIAKAMDKLYPFCDYHILLAREFKEETTLPIDILEYSDDATKRICTQTYLTEKVQLEDRIKEGKTYLYVPLKGKQAIYGILRIITSNKIVFPEKEIDFITEFASVSGKAIESALLYQNSKHLVEDLKLINETTHALNSNLNIVEITSIVCKKIIEACAATVVGFIYSAKTKHHMKEVLPKSTNYFFTNEGEKHADYIFDRVMDKQEPLFSGDFTKEVKDFPYSSVMAIPMLHGGEIHGVIVIIHEQQYAFTIGNLNLMQSLVQHFTLAMANSMLNEKLKTAAVTDYLTKLYSRNHLEEKIEHHFAADEMGSLIVIDIDDFKGINDTFGHYVGDEVIVQIASIILAHTGKNDIPARWGGEEFAIYLSNATVDEGVQIATQIRKQAENFTDPKVTLSCGVATWDTNKRADVKDLFIRADKALYSAKKFGKNCVVKEIEDNSDLKLVKNK
ncbi:GGDEF domain-containing protein [Virgibacillus phasianinus]|uniref:GGDEF domain-containing protein n=1 Tax=Virgibacillus phasianinus TaxID=2017483 RepID=A0A220U4C3_9BACI|nr:diguanylate cyclase [Virgibacillus phasianinus]ASK62940.1 GGDEF domain-containing protein [Virgibacillus phasianinus]